MVPEPTSNRFQRRSALGVAYEHPGAFWSGVTAVITGTLMQLPMFFGAKQMGYRLRGMHYDATMIAGMVLIVAGTLLTATDCFLGSPASPTEPRRGSR